MKIGIDVRAAAGERAGIGYYVAGLVEGLSESDSYNEYFLYSDLDFDWNLEENFKKRLIKTKPGFLWHFFVMRDIAKNKIDLYHSTHSLIIPALLGKRTVLTLHDLSALSYAESHSRKVVLETKVFLKTAVGRSSKVIVPSQFTKEELSRFVSVSADKILVVPEAVAWDFKKVSEMEVEKIRKKYNLPKQYLLFNATMEPRKNLDGLLRAYQSLAEKKNLKMPLVVAGKQGWNYKSTFDLVENFRLNYQVKFLGWVPEEDLQGLYSGALLFIYPSFYEGFGLSPLKAFSCEVPVIVSNTSSLPEVVDGAALSIDPYNVNEIAGAIYQLANDGNLRKSLIEKGKVQLEKFSFKKMATETLKVYQSFKNESAPKTELGSASF